MTIPQILSIVESEIKSREERTYFLIHEARYKRILEEIEKIARAAHSEGLPSSARSLAATVDAGRKKFGLSANKKIRKNNGEVMGEDVGWEKRGTGPLRILDVGCYPYHIGAALEKMGYEVWGIASAHEPIKNKKVAILNIETDKFPYKKNSFDLVLCSEVVEHLPHSPMPALKEMYRVTKPGGHVLITTPNITRSINRGKMLLGKAPVYSINAFLENEGKGSNLYHRHNREYTLGELTRLTKHAGWQISKATHFVSYTPFRRRNRKDNPLLWTGKFANFLAMKAIPRLADTLLVVGEK